MEHQPMYCPFCGHNNIVPLADFYTLVNESTETEENMTEYICHDDACGKSFWA